ncbi:MAG: group I intron-associated PD-(D/E)XK endonuclease [Planctomycetota bacterium]
MDEEIKKLFKKGWGARKIANELGIKHHATVTKKLQKLGLRRKVGSNQSKICHDKLQFSFRPNNEGLPKAAQEYLKFLCYLSGIEFWLPDCSAPYDLIINLPDGIKKIQVKTSCITNLRSNNFRFELRRSRITCNGIRRTKYSNADVDLFFLMDKNLNCWLIPFKKVDGYTSFTPGDRFEGYKFGPGAGMVDRLV